MAELGALGRNVGLACFSGVAINVRARIVHCNCDADPADAYDPGWFGWWPTYLLVPPSRDRAPENIDDWFALYLDPAGKFPDPLPVGIYLGGTSWSHAGPVEVTGMFDHPAAAACTVTKPDETTREPEPACRSTFAVTQIVSAL